MSVNSQAKRQRRAHFPGLCVRLPGVTADARARLPFRRARYLLLRSSSWWPLLWWQQPSIVGPWPPPTACL